MATVPPESSSAVPRWRLRRGITRYREFVVIGVSLALIAVLSAAERLDPSDVAATGTIIDTPSAEWIVLVVATLVAEAAILYAAVKTLVYLRRDARHARVRALMTIAAGILLVLVVAAVWPREHIYTREGKSGYADPPLLGFLVAESDVERRLNALPDPVSGKSALAVFQAFARHGGTPGINTADPRSGTFDVYRGGRDPLDVTVQIASTPGDVWQKPTRFRPHRCLDGQSAGASTVLSKGNVAVLVKAPCPRSPVTDVEAEVALVRQVLASLGY
ncbi:MAG TPA: hypothetical protein VH572_01050 [Gaiella sp.]|jgi:hypothetical protein